MASSSSTPSPSLSCLWPCGSPGYGMTLYSGRSTLASSTSLSPGPSTPSMSAADSESLASATGALLAGDGPQGESEQGCACVPVSSHPCITVTEHEWEHALCTQIGVCVHVWSVSSGDSIVLVKLLFGLDLSGMGFSFRQCVQAKIRALPSCEPGESRGPSLSHCSGLIPSSCEASATVQGRPGCGRGEGFAVSRPTWPSPQTHPDPGTRLHVT